MEKAHHNLSLNLQEIYAAVRSSHNNQLNLVPNIFGTRIYHTGHGWGRVWRVFYIIWAVLFGYGLKYRKIFQALNRTSQAFQREKKQIAEAYKNYKQHLSAEIEDLAEQNLKEYARARWIITHWNDATKPFLSLLLQGNNQKIANLQQLLSRTDSKSSENSKPFFPDPLYAKVAKCQRLINIERYLGVPTPHHLLVRLTLKKRLGREDETAIKTWIEKLNASKKNISVNQLHKGLKHLTEYIKKKHCATKQSEPQLAWLETMLAQRGCSIFREADPKFIAWRNTLKPGQTIECNGRSYELKEQISPAKQSKDNNVIYSVSEHEGIVIHLSKNRALLGLKQVIAKECSWGVRPVNYETVDDAGSCAVIEKLNLSADKIPWTSTTSLSAADKQYAAPLINQINWFLKKKLTPQEFSPRQLMFDSKGTLKCTKISLPGPFNYAKLVQFAAGCSGQNGVVFKHIMKASGLSKHPYASYYKEVAKNVINGVDTPPEDLAAFHRHQIIDAQAIDQAKELQKQLLNLQAELMQKIMKKYQVDDPAPLATTLKRQLLSSHKNSGAICILWPDMKKDVLQPIIKKHQLIPK